MSLVTAVSDVRPAGERGQVHPVALDHVVGQVGLGVRRPGQRHLPVAPGRRQPRRRCRRGQVGGGHRHRRGRHRRGVAMGVHRHQRVGVRRVVGQPGVDGGRAGHRGHHRAVAQHPVVRQVGLGVGGPGQRHPPVPASTRQPGGRGRCRQVGGGGGDRRGRGGRAVAVGVPSDDRVGVRGVVGDRGVHVRPAGERGQVHPVALDHVVGQVGLGVRRPGQRHPPVAPGRRQPRRRYRRGQVGGGHRHRRGRHRRGVAMGVHRHQRVGVRRVVDQPCVGVAGAGDRGHLHTRAQHPVVGDVGLRVGRPGQRGLLVPTGGHQPGGRDRRGQVGGGRGHRR